MNTEPTHDGHTIAVGPVDGHQADEHKNGGELVARIQIRYLRLPGRPGSWQWRIVDDADEVVARQEAAASYRQKAACLEFAELALATIQGQNLTEWHDA